MTAEGGTLADVMRAGVEDLVSTNKVKGTTNVPYRSNCTLVYSGGTQPRDGSGMQGFFCLTAGDCESAEYERLSCVFL